MVKKETNSNSVVVEIANYFIAGIQFRAFRVATTKLGILQAPQKVLKLPLSPSKIAKKSIPSVFEIENNFISGIQFLKVYIFVEVVTLQTSTT